MATVEEARAERDLFHDLRVKAEEVGDALYRRPCPERIDGRSCVDVANGRAHARGFGWDGIDPADLHFECGAYWFASVATQRLRRLECLAEIALAEAERAAAREV